MQDVKQQRAYCTIRKTALACLKEVEGLLCGEGEQLISAKPHVHAQLLADMRGTDGQQTAPAQTPHLLRTPQTAGKSPAGQASKQAAVQTWQRTLPRTCRRDTLRKKATCCSALIALKGPLNTISLLACPDLLTPANAAQGLDLGTTPGRDVRPSADHSGMVKRLIRMFKGEHPAEMLQAGRDKVAEQPE